MVDCTVEMISLSTLSGNVVGHLTDLLLQGREPITIDLLMMGQGVVILIMILSDNLISHGQVRVALTLSSAKAYHFQDVQLLGNTPDDRLGLSPHPMEKAVHQVLKMFNLLRLKTTQRSDI